MTQWLKRSAQAAGISFTALVGVVLARQPEPLFSRDAELTFASDVAPIVFRNCVSCHRPGGIGPFSLLDYEGAKKNIAEIREAVYTGQMPPWHAEAPHGTFTNDRRLSPDEKQTILRWIDAGAKPGDMKSMPPRPVFEASWRMGKPDAIVSMPEEFTVPASGTIEYQYFEVPTNFTEDKWISAMEFMPGSREVVHHVLVFAKVPPVAGAAPPPPRPAGTPAPTPVFIRERGHGIPEGPRRLDTLHAPPRQIGTLIGGTAPGTNVMEFPKGTALRIRAGTVLTFQMHYTAHGHEAKDRSSVGFRFTEMPDEEIYANQFVNGAMVIPAGAKDVAVPAYLTAGQPLKIYGLMPHTHLRGTRWQYTLTRPDSTKEVILDVPRYDFNWQTYYLFAKPVEVPAGGKITSMAWYDNSASNKNNPDASKEVRWGDQTWEEMQYTGFLYTVPSRRLRP